MVPQLATNLPGLSSKSLGDLAIMRKKEEKGGREGGREGGRKEERRKEGHTRPSVKEAEIPCWS
jgi:hypothetical protein